MSYSTKQRCEAGGQHIYGNVFIDQLFRCVAWSGHWPFSARSRQGSADIWPMPTKSRPALHRVGLTRRVLAESGHFCADVGQRWPASAQARPKSGDVDPREISNMLVRHRPVLERFRPASDNSGRICPNLALATCRTKIANSENLRRRVLANTLTGEHLGRRRPEELNCEPSPPGNVAHASVGISRSFPVPPPSRVASVSRCGASAGRRSSVVVVERRSSMCVGWARNICQIWPNS